MFKKLNGIRLVRFEPEYHTAKLYEWYYSGQYDEFFRDIPQCPGAVDLAGWALGKSFMVVRNEGDLVVGVVQCSEASETSRNFEYGALIQLDCQGLGYAVAAMKILLNWKFNSCNFYKAKMKIMAKNKNLCDNLERFGATREGGPHAVLKKECFFEGEFNDIAVYAIFKTEFNKLYSKYFEQEEPRLEAHSDSEPSNVSSIR